MKTASFRLAALHLLLSAASVAVVGAIVLWTVESSLQGQVRERLSEASRALAAQYEQHGLERVRELIQREAGLVGGLDYRLESPAGTRLAGALPAGPRTPGWATLALGERAAGGRRDADALALVSLLPDGHVLTVGEELAGVRQAHEAVLNAFATAILVVLGLGLVGGLVLNAVFLRRVQRIAEAARGVMAGDLARRIPVKGAEDEFGWLATVLNHMLDRIAALVELNRQIGSALAHDLRSPLTRLLRRLEATQLRGGGPAAYERAVEGAVADVNGILDTFNAILRIAQVEAGTRRAAFKRLDLGETVRGVAEAYGPVAQDEGKSVAVETAPELWIDGDAELLTQLVANLVENAIRHTPPGVRIRAAVREEEGRVLLEVADDGPGIPAEHRSRVLERFVRLDRSRSTPGSGLGLTLCAAIADLHDAPLRLDDARPGLRCRLLFPPSAAKPA